MVEHKANRCGEPQVKSVENQIINNNNNNKATTQQSNKPTTTCQDIKQCHSSEVQRKSIGMHNGFQSSYWFVNTDYIRCLYQQHPEA